MSITFYCDGDGCTASAPPGTITGGFPTGWTCRFDYEERAGTKKLVAVPHYCAVCREAQSTSPVSAAAIAAVAAPAKKPARRRAKKADAAPRKRAARKRAPKKPTPPPPVDADGQGGLFD